MYKLVVASVLPLTLFLANLASAEDNSALLGCLQQKVTLSDEKIISRQPYGGVVELTVKNGLSWAISGVFVEQVVSSVDRSVPWFTDTVSDSIAGGVEPGETRTINIYFEGLSPEVPEDVMLELTLLDIGDPQGNQMLRETQILGDGWTDKKSDMGCN